MAERPLTVIEHAAVANPPRSLHLQHDHLGTPRLAKSDAGVIQWRWDSDGWHHHAHPRSGRGWQGHGDQPSVPGAVLRSGERALLQLEPVLLAEVGGYLSPDPIGIEGGPNGYAYVEGNPFAMIDPDGFAACVVNFPDYPIDTGFGFTSTNLGGHGGVLSCDSQGSTRYCEYDRYSPSNQNVIGEKCAELEGGVRRVPVPGLVIKPTTGQPTPDSLDGLREAHTEQDDD